MATTLHDTTHDHHIVTDLVGAVLGVALVVLLLLATLAGAGMVLVRWAGSFGG